MYDRHAQYEIVSSEPDEPLVIRDLGPWDRYLTVTNDAERVVRELWERGLLGSTVPDAEHPPRKLLYYDSEGLLDELVWEGEGAFVSFAPGPGRRT